MITSLEVNEEEIVNGGKDRSGWHSAAGGDSAEIASFCSVVHVRSLREKKLCQFPLRRCILSRKCRSFVRCFCLRRARAHTEEVCSLAHETLSHKLSSTANPECVLVLSNLMWLTHLITDSALVPQRSATLDAVDPFLVLPQVDELVEGLAAGGAGERRGARVGEGVARQELALQEGAAAHDAGEAALGHVQPQVPLELVLHRELLGAVGAREVADAVGVRAQVPLRTDVSICIGFLFQTFSRVSNSQTLLMT